MLSHFSNGIYSPLSVSVARPGHPHPVYIYIIAVILIIIIIIIIIIISATSIRKVKTFPILWDSWSKVALFDISWHFPDQNWSFHFHCHSYFIVVTVCRLLLQCSSWELSWYRTHRLFPLFPILSFSALLVAR